MLKGSGCGDKGLGFRSVLGIIMLRGCGRQGLRSEL